jgi:hypothetical protein
MNLNRDTKRAITYSVMTIILFVIASIFDTGDEENIVAYIAAIGYLITGFVSIWFASKIINKGFNTFILKNKE